MKRRALTLLLCLTLLLSLAIPGTIAFANATNSDGETPAETPTDSGMVVNKTAEKNPDGTYTITLEAYATGAKVISEIKNDVPTDIILVLDQSGSMADDMGTVSYSKYTGNNTQNSKNYEHRHNGGSANLWHMLDDGSYVSVSVTKTTEYSALSQQLVNYETSWFELTTGCYYYYVNNLYEKVGTEYKKVTISRSGDRFEGYEYTYTFSDGTTVTSRGNSTIPDLGSHAPLYTPVPEGNSTVYTYTYTDANGAVQTIGTSTGASTSFSPAFYRRNTNTSGGGSRLSALQSAVTAFASQVASKAAGPDGQLGTADDVNHRIAVVGFASQSGYGNNTELLSISGPNSGSVGIAYDNISNQNLKDVLQSMDTSDGQTMVTNAINALAAEGATQVNLGMDMANRILNANPVNGNEKRNRVVVVFTDGSPTSSNGFEMGVARSAITTATEIKNAGATVYSVGIFAGADATSAGSTSGNTTQKSNWFMQNVSSNNGSVQNPSYYLSAADAGTLSNIFQQISDQIETGGSSSTLESESVVKDIVSEQFTLPEGADASDITLETYKYIGGEQKAASSWTKNDNAMGAQATVVDDQVSVTGFNFSENYVGTVTENGTTTYRGNKLVIKFKVAEKEGLLGGNAIPTNTSAGVYEKSDSANPVISFPEPKVDVEIKPVTVQAQDKNVYLKGTVKAADLQTGATVKVGDVSLDLSRANDADKPYGLEKWQVAYVDITVNVFDVDGKEVTGDYADLTADTAYTIKVTVSPKNVGTVTEKFGDDEGSINVFTPTLTYKDSEAYYGEEAASDFTTNMVSEKWMHNGEEAVASSMLGTKPELNITYTVDTTKLNNNTYTKQDASVAAQVYIGVDKVNEYTTFEHQACTPDCGWVNATDPGNPAFKIHIKTCTLNITKTGGAAGETYVFDVLKDDQKYSEVTVSGNGTETLYELPVGTYTIQENAGWSWRYTTDNGTGATLSATNPNGNVTCTNTKNVDAWLNGFSTVVRNIFKTN